MFPWNEKTIKWFKNASRYTHFHQRLSEHIELMSGGAEALCDIGCGLGLLSFELYPNFKSVTLIDKSSAAIDDVKSEIAYRKLSNVKAICADYREGLKEKYDLVLMSFFSGFEVRGIAQKCNNIIFITNQDKAVHIHHRPAHGGGFGRTESEICDMLKKALIPHTVKRVALEFGQPFVSREEAIDYIGSYNYYLSASSDLEGVLKKIKDTGNKEFPFYLPHVKELSIITTAPTR